MVACQFHCGTRILLCKLLWRCHYPRCQRRKDGSWKTTGLQNASKLRKDFWDTINNSKKVNINLLSEDDVEMYEVGDNKDVIMVIYVPMAKREQKPVYIQ